VGDLSHHLATLVILFFQQVDLGSDTAGHVFKPCRQVIDVVPGGDYGFPVLRNQNLAVYFEVFHPFGQPGQSPGQQVEKHQPCQQTNDQTDCQRTRPHLQQLIAMDHALGKVIFLAPEHHIQITRTIILKGHGGYRKYLAAIVTARVITRQWKRVGVRQQSPDRL